VVACHL